MRAGNNKQSAVQKLSLIYSSTMYLLTYILASKDIRSSLGIMSSPSMLEYNLEPLQKLFRNPPQLGFLEKKT